MHWLSLRAGSSWPQEPQTAECSCGTSVMDSWLESLKATQIRSTPCGSVETERSSPLVGGFAPTLVSLWNYTWDEYTCSFTSGGLDTHTLTRLLCDWLHFYIILLVNSISSFISPIGSMDNTVRLWDAMKAFDDLETDDFTAATGHIHLQDNSQELLLGTYTSKSTPVIHLHFTRRNLLLAAGSYNPWHCTKWIEIHRILKLLVRVTRGFWCSISRECSYKYNPLANLGSLFLP